MKRTYLSVVFTLLMLLSFSMHATSKEATTPSKVRIGYIDKEALLFQMPEITQVNDSIMKAQSSYQQQYLQYEQELSLKTEYLTKNRGVMSDNMLMLKAKEIEDIKQYMQYIQQIAQEDMTILQMKLLEPIEKKIDEAIEAVGVEYGFTYITKVRWDDYMPSVLPGTRPILINHYDISPNVGKGEKLFIPTGEDVMPLVKQKLQIP